MSFISSNLDGKPVIGNLKECLLNPIPREDALWFPNEIRKLDANFFSDIHNKSFKEIALVVLENLLGRDISIDDLVSIIDDCFDFDMPLVKCDADLFVLELFHGPTFTFKDVGARFMSRVLKLFYPKGTTDFDIVVSTSGDTGSAVADAFQDLDNVKVHILYPKNRISEVQEKQLTNYGKNVFAYSVEGNFDDCQDLVKKTLKDDELAERMLFFPANSINVVRMIPQCLYYFWAYAQLVKVSESRHPVVCVPSGNLGNLSGAVLAYKLGLPIKHLISAVNDNDTFSRFLKEGKSAVENPERAKSTFSTAMDISVPNNLKRIEFAFQDSTISDMVTSFSITNQETLDGIEHMYRTYKYVIDPHTSVGYTAIRHSKDASTQNETYILVSTAHPAKFGEIMDKTNVVYRTPEKITNLLSMACNSYNLKAEYNVWKRQLIKNSYTNITFIGMPYSGKSFMANYLSETEDYKVLDFDRLMENKLGGNLGSILSSMGNERFKKEEENTILELKKESRKIVYSPGGSIVYSDASMQHLKKISKIVFLDVPYGTLMIRKRKFEKEYGDIRGIVYKPGQTFRDLFNERYSLYEKYADIRINYQGLTKDDILKTSLFYL